MRMTRWRLAVLATLATLALTGCLRFSADLTLSDDDTVSGSFVVAVKEGTGDHYGMTDRAMSEEIWSDYPAAKVLSDAKIGNYSGDDYKGIVVKFADEPLATFAPTADAWGIQRVGDEFVVSGPSNATTSAAAADSTGDGPLSGDIGQLDDSEFTVTVAFPGDVASTNGTVKGKTVTWNLSDGPTTLDARGSAIPTRDSAITMAYVMFAVIALGAAAYALSGRIARRFR